MKYSDNQLNYEIDRHQIRELPRLILGIGLLFIAYAVAQLFILQEPGYPAMAGFATFCAIAFLILYFVYNRIPDPERHSNRLWGFIAILVLLSTLLRLYATGQPKQSANLILFMAAAGVVFASRGWFFSLIALALGGWGIWVLIQPAELRAQSDTLFWGLVLVSSAATAYLLHRFRVNTAQRMVHHQIKERQQMAEIAHRALQLETSAGVGKSITSILESEKLLPQITSLIRQKYNLQYVGVYLPLATIVPEQIRPEAESGRLRFTQKLPDHKAWQKEFHNVYQNGMITSIDESKLLVSKEAQMSLILPLKMADEHLGVLTLQSDSRMLLRPQDEQVFHLLADQVSVALANAKLYDQIMRMNHDLEGIVAERTKELQTAYARLERLDKTKSDFITIASHELKTPLTLIDVYNQMLSAEERLSSNPTYQKWINQISNGTARLNEIVERMNDVAMIDSESLHLYFGPVNLNLLIVSLVSNLKQNLGQRQLLFRLNELGSLPEVEGDSEALEKVFYQVLSNSIKFTPDGGSIEVNGRFHPPQANQPATVELIVSDSGIGVAPEVKELIFEKFYQTGEVMLHSSGKTTFKGGGAGIGLAIAKGIVQAHHGAIWVESDGYDDINLPGCHFHICLPIKQP